MKNIFLLNLITLLNVAAAFLVPSSPVGSLPRINGFKMQLQDVEDDLQLRKVLKDKERLKIDETNDAFFYDYPKIVYHVDSTFVDRLTNLYRDRIPAKGKVLDMMSSWVSHLPSDIQYETVHGHGLNYEELARNPALDIFKLQNLNDNQTLPFESDYYDAVICAVSVQYLQQPEKVFAEISRVLKYKGVAIISFSNRMFYQKAITGWIERGDTGRAKLVSEYFRSSTKFTEPEIIMEGAGISGGLLASFGRMMGINTGDPFISVIAYKGSKPSKNEVSGEEEWKSLTS